MSDPVIINGDVVGRDSVVNGKRQPRKPHNHIKEDKGRSGGVNISGGKISIGGRVVSGDLTVIDGEEVDDDESDWWRRTLTIVAVLGFDFVEKVNESGE